MLILRIRRAETALADGRLDEAFKLAQAPDIQAHRKGQKLIGLLARALVKRGQEHLAAGRPEQAAADGERAAALAGNLPEVAQLRTAVAEAAADQRRRERRRENALAIAREHVENGRLSIGEGCLAGTDADSARVALLRDQAATRRAQADAAQNRARQALDREDFPEAAAALLEARQLHPANPRCSEMIAQLVRCSCTRAAAAIDDGRLDLADALLAPALRVGGEAVEVRELIRFLDGCREALAGVTGGQPRLAAEALRRLSAMRPTAGWLTHATQNAQQAAEHLEALRSGPLGLLGSPHVPTARVSKPEAGKMPAPPDRPAAQLEGGHPVQLEGGHPARLAGYQADAAMHAATAQDRVPPLFRGDRVAHLFRGGGHEDAPCTLPPRLLFQVDGVGSFLVLRDRRVTIGAAGSSRRPEINLLAEPGLPTAVIERTDEDYFLSCEAGVCVNDSRVTRKLLANGDRIALSPRVRIHFLLPNAASTSAVLRLSGTRLPSCDARQVILLDREMILGPGPAAHIRADQLLEQAIFQVRDGRLLCRSKEQILVNDHPVDRNAGLPPGARVRIGAVSLVVTAV
ncbi:MAG TPA: FHA domain-containing protein [Phycisphaerae bacterium]|nr:FHA domain-containing protein [Phycisphaerae bacterium]